MCWSCSGVQHTYQPQVNAINTGSPEVIFLVFHMSKDSVSQGNKIILRSGEKVGGKLKAVQEQMAAPDRLVVSLLNNEKKALVSANQEHPLRRQVETVNPSGQFERKTVILNEADFFVRMAYRKDAVYVLVEEMIDEKKVSSADFSIR